VLDLDGRERFIDDEEVDSGRRAVVAAAVWVAGGSGTGVSRKSSWPSRAWEEQQQTEQSS
jgi:hypothetical protein